MYLGLRDNQTLFHISCQNACIPPLRGGIIQVQSSRCKVQCWGSLTNATVCNARCNGMQRFATVCNTLMSRCYAIKRLTGFRCNALQRNATVCNGFGKNGSALVGSKFQVQSSMLGISDETRRNVTVHVTKPDESRRNPTPSRSAPDETRRNPTKPDTRR